MYIALDGIISYVDSIKGTLEQLLQNEKSKGRDPRFRSNTQSKCIDRLAVEQKKSIYGMYMEPVFFVKVYLRDQGDVYKMMAVLEVT